MPLGLHYTQSAEYCLQFLTDKENPVIVLSWIIAGNVYPVIEPVDPLLKAGYQTHYVATKRNREPATQVCPFNQPSKLTYV